MMAPSRNRVDFEHLQSYRWIVFFTVLTVNLFIFRIAFPYLEYLFIPSFILMLILSGKLYLGVRESVSDIIRAVPYFREFIFLALAFFISLSYTSHFSVLIIREGLTAAFFLFLCYHVVRIIRNADSYAFLLNILRRQIFIIANLALVIGLIKYLCYLYGIEFSVLGKDGLYPVGTSLKLDHNFFCLVLYFGLLLLALESSFFDPKKQKSWRRWLPPVYVLAIFLSHSRRGFFLLAVFFIFFLVITFYRRRLHLPLFLSFLAIGAITWLLFSVDTGRKNSGIRALRMDPRIVKNELSFLYFEYTTVLINSIEYEEIYRRLWVSEFDPKDPDSGWGTRTYSRQIHLDGPGSEEIPDGTVGYRLDRSTNFSVWNGDSHAYTVITDTTVTKGELLSASVFCFVSEDFNGSWAGLYAAGNGIRNYSEHYDLDKKGTWQKLSIQPRIDEGRIQVIIEFAKSGKDAYRTLEGYVIFAYPVYRLGLFDPLDPDSGWGSRKHRTVYPLSGMGVERVPAGSRGYLMDRSCNASTWGGNAYSYTLIAHPSVTSDQVLKASVYCYVSKEFNGSWVRLDTDFNKNGNYVDYYDLSKPGTWQHLKIELANNEGELPVYLYFALNNHLNFDSLKGVVIFAYPEYQVIQSEHVPVSDNFPDSGKFLPGWRPGDELPGAYLAGLNISCGFCGKILLLLAKPVQHIRNDSMSGGIAIPNYLYEDRLERWDYAWGMYRDYTILQKLFGGGFDYLSEFGRIFFKDASRPDYPHNPLLSVILYSGIIGLIIYLIFMGASVIFYIRYWKYHGFLFWLFLTTAFFVFFSCDTHFDLPMFTFLSLIPFFTRFVINKRGCEAEE